MRSSKSLYIRDYNKPIALIQLMFLTWGFITVINGFLLGELKPELGIGADDPIFGYLFFGAYFVMAFPAGYLIKKIGYKTGFFVGLIIAAISVLMIIPGAKENNIYLVFAAVMVMGSGFTVLQVAGSPYILLLGDPKDGPSRLSLAGAYNSFGTWIAPLMAILITNAEPDKAMNYSIQEVATMKAELVVLPYVLLATVFVGLAVLLHFSDLPEVKNSSQVDTNVEDDNRKYILQYPHVILGAIAIFCYVGAEVGVFMFIDEKFIVQELGITSLEGAVKWIIPFYWGGAMVGRFMGGNILKENNPTKILLIASFAAGILCMGAAVSDGYGALFAIISIGLFNSIMWPVIFNLGIHGMGKHTQMASSLLIMGIIGGAAVPLAIQKVGEHFDGMHYALFIPLLCYVFIAFYAVVGHKYKMKELY
jgi:FHS family L-fucose permease-like MFS transporter